MQDNELHKKREDFRKQIRRQQIDRIKAQARKKFLFKDVQNYNLLSNINLTQTIIQFKQNSQSLEKCIDNMFLYATSTQSDHLFVLLDEYAIKKLQNILDTQYFPTKLIHPAFRKIIYIITNYIVYAHQFEQSIFLTLDKLWDLQQDDIREMVMIIIVNLSEKQYLMKVLYENHFNFLNKILEEINKYSKVQKQIYHLYLMQWLSLIQELIYANLPFKEFPYNKQIIRSLTSILFKSDKPKITQRVLSTLRIIIIYTYEIYPKILLEESNCICQWGQWLVQFVSTHQQTNDNQQTIAKGLKLLKGVFSINIPDDTDQNYYYELLTSLLNNCIGKIAERLLISKSNKIKLHLLELLEPIFMQEQLFDIIYNDYMYILSHVFLHAKNSNIKLKKSALTCLNNLIKVHFDREGMIQKDFLLQLLMDNGIIRLISFTLNEYHDPEINKQLLQSVIILINCKYKSHWNEFENRYDNFMMRKLLEEGIELPLKQLQEHSNKQVQSLAMTILQLLKNQ